MSRESVQKKIQRKAERRAGRKLPTAEAKDSSKKPRPGSGSESQEQAGYSDEFLEFLGVVTVRNNRDGSTVYFNDRGEIPQDVIDEALEQWRESQGEESE